MIIRHYKELEITTNSPLGQEAPTRSRLTAWLGKSRVDQHPTRQIRVAGLNFFLLVERTGPQFLDLIFGFSCSFTFSSPNSGDRSRLTSISYKAHHTRPRPVAFCFALSQGFDILLTYLPSETQLFLSTIDMPRHSILQISRAEYLRHNVSIGKQRDKGLKSMGKRYDGD